MRAPMHMLGGLVFLLWGGLPVTTLAQTEKSRIVASGIGIALSSNGQSIFYNRTLQPFSTNHGYFSVGIHLEAESIPVQRYDPFTGRYYSNPGGQQFYMESGLGWRRLWLKERLAVGLTPHSVVELGGAGYVVQAGRLTEYFKGFTMVWAPYAQVGLGVSIHSGPALYRIDGGYLSTLLDYYVSGQFQAYHGAYLKITFSGGVKRR